MPGSHSLHGRIKRFWIFMLLTSIVAFIANSSVQMILKGEVDVHSAATTSLTMGIVIAILMAAQQNKHD
jgi:uncharacterized membrane protein YhaH (DUF805 family)